MGVTLKMTRAKAMMLSQGLTTGKLADKAGLSRANLNMLLNGRGNPRMDTAELASTALGWDGEPMDLFEEIALTEGAEAPS